MSSAIPVQALELYPFGRRQLCCQYQWYSLSLYRCPWVGMHSDKFNMAVCICTDNYNPSMLRIGDFQTIELCLGIGYL